MYCESTCRFIAWTTSPSVFFCLPPSVVIIFFGVRPPTFVNRGFNFFHLGHLFFSMLVQLAGLPRHRFRPFFFFCCGLLSCCGGCGGCFCFCFCCFCFFLPFFCLAKTSFLLFDDVDLELLEACFSFLLLEEYWLAFFFDFQFSHGLVDVMVFVLDLDESGGHEQSQG